MFVKYEPGNPLVRYEHSQCKYFMCVDFVSINISCVLIL